MQLKEHKCPKGTARPYGMLVKQFHDLNAVFWGVFYINSETPQLNRAWCCPYCGEKLDPAEDQKQQAVRPVKVGETFIVKDGKAYVGDDEVTVPRLSSVEIDGMRCTWERGMGEDPQTTGVIKNTSLISKGYPKMQAMDPFSMLIDPGALSKPVKVLKLYETVEQIVIRRLANALNIPPAQINEDTVIGLSGMDRANFSDFLSTEVACMVVVNDGMTMGQLVNQIERRKLGVNI